MADEPGSQSPSMAKQNNRSQADKRRAMSKLPTWEEVSAMYSTGSDGDFIYDDEEAPPGAEELPAPPGRANQAPRPYSMPPGALPPLAGAISATVVTDKGSNENGKGQQRSKIMSSIVNASSSSPGNSIASEASSSSKPAINKDKGPQTYEEYLEVARTLNFDNIREAQFAYQSGLDYAGRPVVVVCGNVPDGVSPDDLFMYVIDLVDPIAEGDYSVVYVVLSGGKKPSFGWMRKVYSTVPRKYKKNLKQLFIVNPSFWVKTGFQFFRPFISSKFWKKLVYVEEIKQLYTWMSPNQVRLPDYVLKQTAFSKNSAAAFGVSIDIFMAHPMNIDCDLPALVEQSICTIEARGLEIEGIFRLSGNAGRIKKIQESFDKGIGVNLIEETDIHVVTGILKKYIRELPEPLIPYTIFPRFVALASTEHAVDIKKASLQALMCELPPLSFKVLDRLIQLMALIASYSPTNKMTSSNLAIVLGPNIMWPENDSPQTALSNAVAVNSIVQLLIDHNQEILSIPRLKHSS